MAQTSRVLTIEGIRVPTLRSSRSCLAIKHRWFQKMPGLVSDRPGWRSEFQRIDFGNKATHLRSYCKHHRLQGLPLL